MQSVRWLLVSRKFYLQIIYNTSKRKKLINIDAQYAAKNTVTEVRIFNYKYQQSIRIHVYKTSIFLHEEFHHDDATILQVPFTVT